MQHLTIALCTVNQSIAYNSAVYRNFWQSEEDNYSLLAQLGFHNHGLPQGSLVILLITICSAASAVS